MFYSIRVGKEPNEVLRGIIKKREKGKKNPVKMIRINPFFLCQRSYHFWSNWSDISFLFPFQSFDVFPRPFETPKNEQLFFGTHTHCKKDNAPPLTTEFIHFIVIDMSYRDRISNLLSSCLAGKDWPTWKGWIIPSIARIHVVYLKEVDLLASLTCYNPLPAEPPFPSIHKEKIEDWCQQFITEGRKDSLSRDH